VKYYFYAEEPNPLSLWTDVLSRKTLAREWSKKLNPMGVYSHYGHGTGVIVELQQILQFNKYRKTIERLFQIQPSVKGIFHTEEPTAGTEGESTGIITMVQILSAILALEIGGAILLSADHNIILRKQGNILLLNSDFGFWTPSRLANIHLPCELRSLPTPLADKKL
jgi:hypothetical protein